jgi:type I restriction enzyme R subunit
MPTVGQIEKITQGRVLALFRERLRYDCLGDLRDQDNRNIKTALLRAWLLKRGVEATLADKALRELDRAANGAGHLYDLNREVYRLLRYGVKVRTGVGENHVNVFLIDWGNPEANDFAVAEEVTVKGADLANAAKAETKRPDVVIYINGIALGVLELKRSTVSVSEGIRQNLDNQKKEFIQPFFTTMQWVMAGNDSEGLRYGTIETSEKYYLAWVEPTGTYANEENLLDRHLLQVCNKARFLELMHDFVVFDAGIKKLCRQNQYFGIKAAQDYIRRREGGIIWHTQGSGKTLTMVWLAQWLRENCTDARVLIITDRKELDQQIETNFIGIGQEIFRTKSGADLIYALNATAPWLIGSLVHKFGGRSEETDEESVAAVKDFADALKQLPPGFKAKGDVYVFVDECHRTQSGELNKAMRAILPDALFIGFTGTPLLHADKDTSRKVWGDFIRFCRISAKALSVGLF